MKITIENTDTVINLTTRGDASAGEIPARLWVGTTEYGVPVTCFVTRLAVNNQADTAQFERELAEQPTDGEI